MFQDRSYKKTKKTTATQKTKNSLLIIRAIQSHCSLTRENYDRVQVRGQKKGKTTSDSRAAISSSAPPK
jgi:hypothetical protein